MNPIIKDNIKNVVVLMLENRSFDHLFGDFPGVNGIQSGGLYNLLNPAQPSLNIFRPNPVTTLTQPDFNPHHPFPYMMHDLFGPTAVGYVGGNIQWQSSAPPFLAPGNMNGFVAVNPTTITGPDTASVMSYFSYLPKDTPGRLNVLHTLAEEFVLCDNWFCDTPSETVPNRHFMHAATNMGYNDTDSWPGYEPGPGSPSPNEAILWNAKTIYQQLDSMNPQGSNPNWAMYGFPQDEYDSGMYAYTASLPQANRSIFDFPVDVLTGNLPFYTFIMPSLLFGLPHSPRGNANGNSMHPSGDVRLGENLVASIYNILRNSPLWENTLFIITFDENGGIYDHILPPPATAPDQYQYKVNNRVLFDYSILGPRIPALLISPWLAKGNIDPSQYQNTSILRFAQDLFAAQNNISPVSYLTQRDGAAQSFASSPAWLGSMRTSCPQLIPLHEGFPNWGTEMTDPYGDDPYSGPGIPGVTKPAPSAIHFAETYCSQYPGHPDSGKPLARSFDSHEELVKYMIERRRAARAFYKKGSKS